MATVRVEGEVEPDDAPILELVAWEAFGARGTQIILDLECCSHLSSTGLGVLFSLARWVQPKKGRVIAFRPSAQVLRLLSLVRLTDESGFLVVAEADDLKRLVSPDHVRRGGE